MSPLSVGVLLALLWGTSVLLSTELTAAAVPETSSSNSSSFNSTAQIHQTPTEKPTPPADRSHTPAEVDASKAAERSHPTTVGTHDGNNSGESAAASVAFSTTVAAAGTAGPPLHHVSHRTLETVQPTERGPQLQQQQASTTLKAMTSSDAATHGMIQSVTAAISVPQPVSNQEHLSAPTTNPTSLPSAPMTSPIGIREMSDSVAELSSTSKHALPTPTHVSTPATVKTNSTSLPSDHTILPGGVREMSTSVTESSSTPKDFPPTPSHTSTPATEKENSTSPTSDHMTLPGGVREISTSVTVSSSPSKNPPPTSSPASTPATEKANSTSLPSDPTTALARVREISTSGTSTSKHLSPAPTHTSTSEVHPIGDLTSTPGSLNLSTSSTNGTTTASSFIPSTTSTSAAPCVVPSGRPSGEPYTCSTRGMARQCLIAVASLAALATVFMVCTVVLCAKLSARKYKVRSPPATEMMCLPSLLNERSYHYARHRNPVTNGVLVIHGGGDSDEDGGDNLTLSSFLPENERYV